MEPATWTNCCTDLADAASDGALIDLLVPGSGLVEWERFCAALRVGPFELHTFRDGEPIPWPDSAAWALAASSEAVVLASVVAGPVTANCHFFGGDLELDIDPREVTDQAAFAVVIDLMRFIASAVQLPVLAALEGSGPAGAFLRVSPDGQAEFLPPRGSGGCDD